MNGEERSRLDVIEAKIDVMNTKLDFLVESRKDHEGRLRSVEKWKMSVPMSMLLALATIIGAFISRI